MGRGRACRTDSSDGGPFFFITISFAGDHARIRTWEGRSWSREREGGHEETQVSCLSFSLLVEFHLTQCLGKYHEIQYGQSLREIYGTFEDDCHVCYCPLPTIMFRRLARRGGVKRISALVYDDMRSAVKQRLELVSTHLTSKQAAEY